MLVFMGGIAQLPRDILQNGVSHRRARETKCQEGGSLQFEGVLTSLRRYRAIWGIAAIVSQYRAVWSH